MSKRRLFCELSPAAYKISVFKCRGIRRLKDILSFQNFSVHKCETPLPVVIYRHNSLIRRRLGDVDMLLQDNKAVNLGIAAPLVSNIMIKPGETFSFWSLVGDCSAKKGYKVGLMVSNGRLLKGMGGGMCQFTNLIHWMVLHTPMKITEHHHHDGLDLFPDYGRQIPFGTGTSIVYNYLDYRFMNPTDITFQLVTYTSDEYLHGEIRADKPLPYKYHVKSEGEFFSEENGRVYRNGTVFRECVDIRSGNLIMREPIRKNHARVMYDTKGLNVVSINI